jgi:hypothetical protein
MRPWLLKKSITKIKREILIFSGTNTPKSSLVRGVLKRGNRWFFWWPEGMKMSGFVGDGGKGRLVEVKQ